MIKRTEADLGPLPRLLSKTAVFAPPLPQIAPASTPAADSPSNTLAYIFFGLIALIAAFTFFKAATWAAEDFAISKQIHIRFNVSNQQADQLMNQLRIDALTDGTSEREIAITAFDLYASGFEPSKAIWSAAAIQKIKKETTF